MASDDVTIKLVNTRTWHAGPFTLRATEGNDYVELDLQAKVVQPSHYRLERRDLVALMGLVNAALSTMDFPDTIPEVSHARAST